MAFKTISTKFISHSLFSENGTTQGWRLCRELLGTACFVNDSATHSPCAPVPRVPASSLDKEEVIVAGRLRDQTIPSLLLRP